MRTSRFPPASMMDWSVGRWLQRRRGGLIISPAVEGGDRGAIGKPGPGRGFCLVALVLLAGCADVKPWERGTLAKDHMALQPYPIQQAFRGHIYGAREAASGGSESSGGGCGCY